MKCKGGCGREVPQSDLTGHCCNYCGRGRPVSTGPKWHTFWCNKREGQEEMKDMLLIVHESDLANLIQDLKGWHNLQVRFLDSYGDGRYYNVHLTKKQVAELGASRIKDAYHANEYKPLTPVEEQVEHS